MNLKRKIAAGAAACFLLGSAMNVSAAEVPSKDYVNTLIENNQVGLIMNVEAYKAAYPDLAIAFGDDTSAYVNHYLTIGLYEGRTKGVLFNPLAYAEAYGDIQAAYGNNISEIVQHYVTCGISENRIQGTACGYADIATAQNAGVQSVSVQNPRVQNTSVSRAIHGTDGRVWYNENPANPVSSAATGIIGSDINYGNNANIGSPVNTSAPVNTDKGYHHTTSIYADDEKTLLRVEYLDENGKVLQYSSVEAFDSETNSYTENIYHYDEETDTQVLDRTDTYENGTLVSSQ